MNDCMKEQLEELTQMLKELTGIYRGAISCSGISENEFWIWYALIIMGGEYSQQDICDMWSMSKQTINTIISNMVRRELVVLEVIPHTRNRKVIRLTEAGRKYGENIVMPIFEAEQRAIERLPLRDQLACTAAFRKYICFLKEEIYRTETEQ